MNDSDGNEDGEEENEEGEQARQQEDDAALARGGRRDGCTVRRELINERYSTNHLKCKYVLTKAYFLLEKNPLRFFETLLFTK